MTAMLAGLVLLVAPVRTADHRDAPGINEDPRADINDIYAFLNPGTGNVVLAMTVNPFQIGGLPGIAFGADVLYEFKIDNDGDNVEDLVVQTTFSPLVPGPQRFTVRGPAKPRTAGTASSLLLTDAAAITGPADGTITSGTGNIVRAFAGLRDDPFFFDLIWGFRLLGIQPGGPLARPGGIDFFQTINCSIIALEIPPGILKGRAGNVLRIWATTGRAKTTVRSGTIYLADTQSGPFVQVDRMAFPVENTVLMPTRLKDAFNHSVPSQDHLFRDEAISHLVAINNDAVYSRTLVDAVLFPDVLTLDVTKTTGFLNGRRPQDDVIDVVLQAASKGAVGGDGVDANDVPFLTEFPFFAPPHAATTTVPPRDKGGEFWTARMARDPYDYISPTRLGYAYLSDARRSGDFRLYGRAESALNEALRRAPDHATALLGLASARAARHRFAEAAALARKVASAQPGDADAYAALGDAEFGAGNLREAEAAYDEVARRSPGFDADTRRANLLHAEGRLDESVALMRRALADARARDLPADSIAWCHVILGSTLFERGEYAAAETEYQAALRLTPASYLALEHLAELRAYQYRDREAIALYEQAIALAPHPDFFEAIARVHEWAGRANDAKPWHLKARDGYRAAVDAGDPGYYRHLAMYYADVERRPEDAVMWAKKDLELRHDAEAWATLAWTLQRKGDADGAREANAKALAINPAFKLRTSSPPPRGSR